MQIFNERQKTGRKQKDLLKFWTKINYLAPNGCWEYKEGLSQGYGQFTMNYKTYRTHQIAYEQLVGKVPEGLQLDHLCHNRKCVNPMHLEPVTIQENVRLGMNFIGEYVRKTHCKNGHVLAGDNIYPIAKYGGMVCKICNSNRAKYYQSLKKGVSK